MSDNKEIFAAEGDSNRWKKGESSRMKGFDRRGWESEGSRLPPRPSEHFKPGALVKDGMCQIAGSIGEGGMCEVFSVTINDYWEVLRQHLLQGDIEKLWQYTGITADDIKDGLEPTAKQRQNVDSVIVNFKKQYGERFPQQLMGYIDEKLRGGTAVLKVLRPTKTDDDKENQNDIIRLQQEASVMKYDLNHPNIIKVFHYFVSDEYHCILEELVGGAKSLSSVLSEYPLPKEEVALIGSSVFGAICHSHDNDILWRDCNPKNILVVYDEEQRKVTQVKAIDWGIAKRLRGTGIESLLEDTTTKKKISLTGKKNIVGTPNYLSPEQIENPKATGKPTDFFSLGSTLYQAVTGNLAFTGKDEYEIAFNLTLPDPEKNPEMPNIAIKKQRETAIQNRQIDGFKSNAPLPEYVSEEFEDLIMMLLEKDERKRVRADYIAELFKNIHEHRLYEKQEISPEQAKQRDEEAQNVLAQAEGLENQLGKIPEGAERTSALLGIAGEYEKAAHIIPRMLDEDTLPEFSRMEAFLKAVEYYKKAGESYKPHAGEAHLDTEHIENKIHRLECRYRVEFMRADQLRLLKKGEKTAKKEPKSFHRLFGTGYVLSKLQSAIHFLEKGMFVAARKEWEDAERYSGKNKGVSSSAYMQLNNFKNTFLDMKEKATHEASVLKGINAVERLIDLRRFKDADQIVSEVSARIDNNRILSGKSDDFARTLGLLDNLNRNSENEYARFQEIARAAGIEKDNLKKLRADLRAGTVFPKSALDDARSVLDSVMQEYRTLDRILAGEAHCAELERTFEEISETYRILSVQLAKTIFLSAGEKLGMLSKLNPQIDKYSPDVTQKIAQAHELIAQLEGDTGLGNIETGESHVPAERVKELKDRLRVEKERFYMLSADVKHFKSLEAKAETGNDEERTAACRALAMAYMVDVCDLDRALFYFEKMPGYAKDLSRATDAETDTMIRMFGAYKKIRDESMFVKRTMDGLDERVIKHVDHTRKEQMEYISRKEKRNDASFDTHFRMICGYIGTNPEEILAIRGRIDEGYAAFERLRMELQSLKTQQPADPNAQPQYSAQINEKEEEFRKTDVYIKEQTGNFAEAVGAVIESAQKRIDAEGVMQPEDKIDYIRVAAYLKDLSASHHSRAAAASSAEFYNRYLGLVPENSREAETIRQNLAHLNLGQQKP